MKSKTQRILAVILSVLMMVSVFSACGKTAESTNNPATPGNSGDNNSAPATQDGPDISKEVTIQWMYHGSSVSDDKAVMEEINKYLKEKINAKLEMIWCSWSDFDDRARLAVQGGDPIDIYFTSSWTPTLEYAAAARQGVFVRLDNPENNLLEKYAPNLFNEISPVLADAARTDGADGVGIYAIPTYKEIAQQYTWDINTDILKKYGYTVDDVKDFYQLGPILETIKQGEGKDFYPLFPEPAVLERLVNNNDLVDGDSLLAYEFDPVDPAKSGVKIVSRYETEGYKKFVEQMHQYYQKGYISPEMASAQTMVNARVSAQNAAKYAISTQTYYPGYEVQTSAERGITVVYKPSHTAIISTTSARGAMQAISTLSDDPGRALMFLNLVNTDPKLITMLAYGIEGMHYTKMSDGRVSFDKAMRETYRPWKAGLGKQSIIPLMEDEPSNFIDLFNNYNNSAKPVPILGFAFNADPVKTEIAALANVAAEYRDALNSGAVDPAEKLPEFINKLKANGIDKVVAEAQRQLDEFMAAKK